MSHHPTDFQGDILTAMREAIAEAIPGAEIQVQGGGGHFEVAVVSEVFEGKRTLGRHRLVMAALAPLMSGDNAPVHAIDRLQTSTPS